MIEDRLTTVAFTGHRTYDDEAAAALRAAVGELYARGFRTFLCGMAVGFDLAAAEAVLACRDCGIGTAPPESYASRPFSVPGFSPASADCPDCPNCPDCPDCPDSHSPQNPMPGLRLVAVIPFRGQGSRFSAADRERFRRVLDAADRSVTLSPSYHAGCYAVRNNYLVDHAALLVAWYDGSPGGTHYTVRRALARGLEFVNLHSHPAALRQAEPTLF